MRQRFYSKIPRGMKPASFAEFEPVMEIERAAAYERLRKAQARERARERAAALAPRPTTRQLEAQLKADLARRLKALDAHAHPAVAQIMTAAHAAFDDGQLEAAEAQLADAVRVVQAHAEWWAGEGLARAQTPFQGPSRVDEEIGPRRRR